MPYILCGLKQIRTVWKKTCHMEHWATEFTNLNGQKVFIIVIIINRTSLTSLTVGNKLINSKSISKCIQTSQKHITNCL